MKKGGQGFCQEFVGKKESIVVSAWFDNKQVLTISNLVKKHFMLVSAMTKPPRKR